MAIVVGTAAKIALTTQKPEKETQIYGKPLYLIYNDLNLNVLRWTERIFGLFLWVRPNLR